MPIACGWNSLVCLLLHSLINRGQRDCGPCLFMVPADDKRCGPDTHSSLLPLQHTSSIRGISPFKREKKGYNITSFRLRERLAGVTGWRDSCHSLLWNISWFRFQGKSGCEERRGENLSGLVEAVQRGGDWSPSKTQLFHLGCFSLFVSMVDMFCVDEHVSGYIPKDNKLIINLDKTASCSLWKPARSRIMSAYR